MFVVELVSLIGGCCDKIRRLNVVVLNLDADLDLAVLFCIQIVPVGTVLPLNTHLPQRANYYLRLRLL